MTEQTTPKMTHDEMIDALKGLVFGTFDRTTAKEREALEMAIDALEKEIPKPISIENGFVKCGRCGKYIRFPIMDHYNNCPECGQKILWKGDTE